MLVTGLVACRIADIDFAKCRVLLVASNNKLHFGSLTDVTAAAVAHVFIAPVQPAVVDSFGHYSTVGA